MTKPYEFTHSEQQAMEHLNKAHSIFIDLNQDHPADLPEWVHSLHNLQRILAIRISRRVAPNLFHTNVLGEPQKVVSLVKDAGTCKCNNRSNFYRDKEDNDLCYDCDLPLPFMEDK